MVEAIRRVLPSIKASSTPPYRGLLETVGLPIPAGHLGGSPFGRGAGLGRGWQGPMAPTSQEQHALNQIATHAGMGYQPSPSYGYPQQQHNAQIPYPRMGMYGDMSSMSSALSPLLMPQNMPLGQSARQKAPSSDFARHEGGQGPLAGPVELGRMSPGSMLMSPSSDPFNPFASPSIDNAPYYPQFTPTLHQPSGNPHQPQRTSSLSQPPVTMPFEPQQSLGSPGIVGTPSGAGLGTGMELGLVEGYWGQQRHPNGQGMYDPGYQA